LTRPRSATIAIDALSAVAGGGLSVSRGLATGLSSVRPNWKIHVFASHTDAVPDRPAPNLEVWMYPRARKLLGRWALEQFGLPRISDQKGVDAILLLGGFKLFGSSIPQVAVWQNAHLWTPPLSTHSRALSTYIAIQRLFMQTTLSRVQANVFLSLDSARRAQDRFGSLGGAVHVAAIGIDEEFQSQVPRGSRRERRNILLAVGDIYAHKRFDLAIEALAHLKDRHEDLELWIAGRALDLACEHRLLEQVDQYGLEGRVRFLGHVRRAQLIDLYRSALVFVATSRLETFGLTPIEAMSCGLPVVATTESAVPEICGQAARYAESTGEAIADAVDRLLIDPSEWEAFQDLGLARSRLFCWKTVAEKYAEIIESILAPGRSSDDFFGST
jgi:glycosyltransferase involved in cell wall biosynthesis